MRMGRLIGSASVTAARNNAAHRRDGSKRRAHTVYRVGPSLLKVLNFERIERTTDQAHDDSATGPIEREDLVGGLTSRA